MTIRPRVLVVDDDPATQHLLATLAEQNELSAVRALDGKTAIALLGSNDFGAVLLDLLLPEMNGFEVLRHIACVHAPLLARVIVITAAHESLWRECPYLGRIHKLVPKPILDLPAFESDLVNCCNGH